MASKPMPVLVGAGQSVNHWDGADGPVGAPSPLSLAADATKAALLDAGAPDLASVLDLVAFVRIFEDSVPGDNHPHGHNSNLPGTLARDIGANAALLVYSSVGGQSPQALISEVSARIHAGEFRAALVAGSEANRASKAARRKGLEIDWMDSDDRDFEDRGLGDMLLSRAEIKHGLVSPPYFYALFETAIAAREGRTRAEHRAAMSDLFARFANVAAGHPFAQFPIARSKAFLETPSKENYEIADPFLKWHVAQDAVNQGAAVLIVAEDLADELEIPAAKRVYLHGGGEASDRMISERARIDGSEAMETALSRALEAAGKSAAEIDLFDLYSCFPCAVFSSTAALGIEWRSDPRPLTVTGGLPFFGGPGNNYALHGVASLVESLRARPGAFGLALANGGWMSKEAAGIYSTDRPADFAVPAPSAAPAAPAVDVINGPGPAALETYTIVHGRQGPEAGIAFLRHEAGARIIAKAAPEAIERLREDRLSVGAKVAVATDGEVNTFRFSD